MINWLLGRHAQGRRVEALEREAQHLRALSSDQAERHQEVTSSLNAVTNRVSALTDAFDAIAKSNAECVATLNSVTAELERLRSFAEMVLQLKIKFSDLEEMAGPKVMEAATERAKANAEALIKMQAAMKRTERQLDRYTEETRKTGAALLERIEMYRVSRPASLPADDP